MHRDIKPANVLLDGLLHAKVSDFGISKQFGSLEPVATRPSSPSGLHTGRCGTARYMAPEVAEASHYEYSQSCDAYSFGCTIWELMHNERIPAAPQERLSLALPASCDKIGELIVACWHFDPEQRPPMTECADQLAALQGTLPRETAQAVSSADWQVAARESIRPPNGAPSTPESHLAPDSRSGLALSCNTFKVEGALPHRVSGGGVLSANTSSMLARWQQHIGPVRGATRDSAEPLNSLRSSHCSQTTT